MTGPSWKSRMYAQETAALRNLTPGHSLNWGRRSPTCSSDLPGGQRRIYKFALTPTPKGYSVLALPTPLAIVSRTFYTDQSLVIRGSYGPKPATANSKVVGSAADKPGEKM